MKTPFQLFTRRIKINFALQRKAIAFVTDASSIIYIAIPVLLFVIGYYRSIMIHPPEWLYSVTPFMFSVVYIVFFLIHSYRSYYEYADQLFLSHKHSWMRAIKRYGVLYNIMCSLFINAIILSILLPVIISSFDYSFTYILMLLFNNAFIMVVVSLIKRRLYVINSLPIKILLYLVFIIVAVTAYIYLITQGSIMLMLGSCTILMIILLLYYVFIDKQKWDNRFVSYTAYDLQLRYRLVGNLLKQLNIKVDTKKKANQKPYLFRTSQPIFKRNRSTSHIVAESFLKSRLRQFEIILMIFYVIISCCVGMAQIDQQGQIVFLVLIMWFLSSTIKNSFYQFLTEDFINILKIEQQQRKHGLQIVVFWITSFFIFWIVVLSIFFMKSLTLPSILLHIIACAITYVIVMVVIHKVNAR